MNATGTVFLEIKKYLGTQEKIEKYLVANRKKRKTKFRYFMKKVITMKKVSQTVK